MHFIEENIDNSEFSVEELSQHTAMSRSVFFKKIKSLTGLTPVEFIRDIRMQRAAQILESGEYMVKEVSYMVGISDTKYFAKCFRAKYGLSPLEYKNKQKEWCASPFFPAYQLFVPFVLGLFVALRIANNDYVERHNMRRKL